MLDPDGVIAWLEAAASRMAENRELLTDLDAAIGDGDHGINMDRGFRKVRDILRSTRYDDVGSIFESTGRALLSSVGGASGPLYGTLFLRAGAAAAGKRRLDTGGLVDAIDRGVAGVIERGRAKQGEKTMVDALAPAASAMRAAAQSGKSMKEAVREAVFAAEKGMRDTVAMKAKRGRASYLGDRSVGHQDPGATSVCLLLAALGSVLSD
jgi:dihydroxyacetone kinase-like protein